MRRFVSGHGFGLAFLTSFEPKLLRQALLVLTTNLLHLNSGYGIGFSSPTLSQLSMEEFYTPAHSSWFASTLVLGQICGSLFGPVLADKIGRRRCCVLGAFFSIIGWSLLCASSAEWMLFLGRFTTGFFDCLSVPVSIMFVSEVSETRLKGSFLNSSALASGLGIALAYFTGSVFYWRYACFFPIVFAGVAIFLFFFCPESPVFLLTQNQEASEALKWYRESRDHIKNNEIEIERELKDIENETANFGQGFRETLADLSKQENRKPFLILVIIFFLYPLTGMYSITFFAVDLFKKLNLGSAQTVAIVSALLRCLGTSLSSFLMFKYGRRKIMLVSTTIVCITLGMIAMFLALKDGNVGLSDRLVSWILIIFIFIFMFNVGVSVVNMPWVLMGEWFPPNLKSIVSGSLITLQFATIFTAVQTTNPIIHFLGTSGLFSYFAAVCAVKTGSFLPVFGHVNPLLEFSDII